MMMTEKIYIYHTSLLKILPNTNVDILNENNVNTAFTRTCPSNSEIVVFRKEEWFKVFIHETFHSFGIDFASMNTSTKSDAPAMPYTGYKGKISS
jgi:L-rhamnose isomerase